MGIDFQSFIVQTFHLPFPLLSFLLLLVMPPKKRKRTIAEPNSTQLDAFAAGVIAALANAGYSETEICDSGAVSKLDGSPIGLATIGKVVRRFKTDPLRRGVRRTGSLSFPLVQSSDACRSTVSDGYVGEV